MKRHKDDYWERMKQQDLKAWTKYKEEMKLEQELEA